MGGGTPDGGGWRPVADPSGQSDNQLPGPDPVWIGPSGEASEAADRRAMDSAGFGAHARLRGRNYV